MIRFKSYYKSKLVLELRKMDKTLFTPEDNNNLPMSKVFGDKLRLVRKLGGYGEYKARIGDLLNGWDIDLDEFVAYKDGRGKPLDVALNKSRVSRTKVMSPDEEEYNKTILQQIKNATTPEEKKSLGSQLKQPKVTDLSGDDVEHNKKIEDFVDTYSLNVNAIKDLKSAKIDEQLYIIYSRAPIDILRMGDHGEYVAGEYQDNSFRHCHSPNDGFYSCAVAEAQKNSAIAYLVTKSEFQNIKNLQSDEIFLDMERSIRGIVPYSRIRIRIVYDEDGNELIVPSSVAYGTFHDVDNAFKSDTVRFAKSNMPQQFNWDGELRVGGGYIFDSNDKIDDNIKRIYKRDVKVEITQSNTHRDKLIEVNDIFKSVAPDVIEILNDGASENVPLFKYDGVDFSPYLSDFNRNYTINIRGYDHNSNGEHGVEIKARGIDNTSLSQSSDGTEDMKNFCNNIIDNHLVKIDASVDDGIELVYFLENILTEVIALNKVTKQTPPEEIVEMLGDYLKEYILHINDNMGGSDENYGDRVKANYDLLGIDVDVVNTTKAANYNVNESLYKKMRVLSIALMDPIDKLLEDSDTEFDDDYYIDIDKDGDLVVINLGIIEMYDGLEDTINNLMSEYNIPSKNIVYNKHTLVWEVDNHTEVSNRDLSKFVVELGKYFLSELIGSYDEDVYEKVFGKFNVRILNTN